MIQQMPKNGTRRKHSVIRLPAANTLKMCIRDRLRAGYYAAITHMDHQIGRLVSALVEEQIMDNTIILFVSDHGEMLGDRCV